MCVCLCERVRERVCVCADKSPSLAAHHVVSSLCVRVRVFVCTYTLAHTRTRTLTYSLSLSLSRSTHTRCKCWLGCCSRVHCWLCRFRPRCLALHRHPLHSVPMHPFNPAPAEHADGPQESSPNSTWTGLSHQV